MVDRYGIWTEEKDYSTYPKKNGVCMITWLMLSAKQDMKVKPQWKI